MLSFIKGNMFSDLRFLRESEHLQSRKEQLKIPSDELLCPEKNHHSQSGLNPRTFGPELYRNISILITSVSKSQKH